MDSFKEKVDAAYSSDLSDVNSYAYDVFLTQIFNFGVIKPKIFSISEGFNVTLRLLTPMEFIEVLKKVEEFNGNLTKEKILIIETLSRAIERVNGQFLRFDDEMVQDWKGLKRTDRDPSVLEQQRDILLLRFQQLVLNVIYEKYIELQREQEKMFDALKKKD